MILTHQRYPTYHHLLMLNEEQWMTLCVSSHFSFHLFICQGKKKEKEF